LELEELLVAQEQDKTLVSQRQTAELEEQVILARLRRLQQQAELVALQGQLL
jgi:hypothetical protein